MTAVVRPLLRLASVGGSVRPTRPRAVSERKRPKTNLVRVPTMFVGRVGDLVALRELLRGDEQLVTIVGVGGVGKTRLAREIGHALVRDYSRAGGVWFCDVTAARDVDEICAVVGGVLGVAPIGRGNAVEETGRALAARSPVLMILDNFEQVVAHAGATVERWMEIAPRARLLVTSRERLRTSAGTTYELGPLAVPEGEGDPRTVEAVRLLVDRARKVRRGYAPSAAEAADLARIVRRLDGIPLAIELAAARVALLGAAVVRARLPEGPDLLGDPSGGPSRHATLRSTIDWSWDLLRPHERAALAQCSVFRGGFSIEAAEGVVDLVAHPEAPRVLDVVQALRSKSLLTATEPPELTGELRFGFYESIREYAASRLDPTEAEAAQERHGAYYVRAGTEWAAGVYGSDGDSMRARLVLDRENLLAVIERAVASRPVTRAASEGALRALLAVDYVLTSRGPFAAHLLLLDSALAAAAPFADVHPELRARVILARVNLRRAKGIAGDEDVSELGGVLELARKTRPPLTEFEGRVLYALGAIAFSAGRLDEARPLWLQALAKHRAVRDRRFEAITLGALGNAAAEGGRLEEGETYADRAIAIDRSIGNHRHEAWTLDLRGEIARFLGRYGEAEKDYGRALAIARRVGDRRVEAYVEMDIGQLHRDLGRLVRGRRQLERAASLFAGIGSKREEGVCLGHIASVAREQRRFDDARALLERACTALDETSHPSAGFGWAQLGGVEAALGHLPEARAALDRARRCIGHSVPAGLETVVDLEAGHLELRAAAEAARANAFDESTRLRRAVRGRIELSLPLAARSAPVRLAVRALERALEWGPAPTDGPAAPALTVEAEGRWCELPSGSRVDFRKRRVLRQLLTGLAERRIDSPGRSLSHAELLEMGWPGERMMPESAEKRLSVAIVRLRQLGLGRILTFQEGGYLLDPAVPLRLAHVPAFRRL